jgi:putative two-component system response regulator
MEQHCEIGASILTAQPKGIAAFLDSDDVFPHSDRPDNVDALRRMAATIILTHHERWDGSGYPNHLRGDDIPVCGQVVAVADVYDALRSARPYKQPFTVEQTVAQMQLGRGSHFAPHVFDAFANIVDSFEEIRARFTESEDLP